MNKQRKKQPNRQQNKQKDQAILEQYPNEGVIGDIREAKVQEYNHFKNHSEDVIRRKYMKFNAFMETLYEILELRREASMDEFAQRIYHIVMAAVPLEDRPEKE